MRTNLEPFAYNAKINFIHLLQCLLREAGYNIADKGPWINPFPFYRH